MNRGIKFAFLVSFVAILGVSVPKSAHAINPPAGFQIQTVLGGLDKPTSMAFVPDGRIFIAEKDGKVRVVKNGVLLATPLITLNDINTAGDHGILGIAVDPNFSQNGYVYLAYTFENNASNYNGPKTGRIVRITAVGDTASLASKVTILGKVGGTAAQPSCTNFAATADCIHSDSPAHSMGGLRFGTDGKLYAALGDGAGFENVDANALHSQDLNVLAGKYVRINTDGTAPTDNPFYNGDVNANRSKVWALGLRNAYRFNFRPSNGKMYIGEVGWKTWEEINIGKKGANYGWPCREGLEKQPEYNCTASSVVTDPIYVYDHSSGSGSVTGGAFPTNNVYPAQYMSTYFFGDYSQNFLRIMNVDANDNLLSVSTFSDDAAGPVEIVTGPDGYIYYLAIYTGELRKITYTTGNTPPVAQISANPLTGQAPLTVTFSSAGSSDANNDPLTYAWNFGDNQTSTQANPQHTYAANGNYTATLTVSDGKGGSNSKTVLIRVGTSNNNNVVPHHVQTTVSPAETYIGRDAVITSTITNTGEANPFIVDIEIYDKANNTKISQKVFENETIPTNGSKNYEYVWFPPAVGNYRVAVGLFQQNWLGIYEWTNTALDITVLNRAPTTTPTTTPPTAFAPAFESVTATPNPVTSGQNTAITAAIKNTGGAGNALVDIEVYKDGTKVDQKFYDNEAFTANQTRNFTLNWTSAGAGTYKVSVGIFKPGWSQTYSWNADVGTITITSGTTPPPPATSTPITIFTTTNLESGWANWSWDTAVTMGQELRAQYSSAWAGLFLHANNSVNTTGKTTLSFDINGLTTGNQALQVYLYDQSGAVLTKYALPSVLANTWAHIDIPLSSLNAANKVITGMVFQGTNGAVQGAYLLDNLQIK